MSIPIFAAVHGRRLLAIALTGVTYAAARAPGLKDDDRAALAAPFHFETADLPTVGAPSDRRVRHVNPQLARIATWISSVGGSVALNDLDADGLPNDVCYVDVRSDQVVVTPVPGGGERYAPFALDPSPLPFDRGTMAPMGCLPADLNEDGTPDLLVYYWGRAPIAFLAVARGSGSTRLDRSHYLAREVVPGSPRWFSNAALFADVDGDGHGDLVIGNYFPDGAHVLDTASRGPEHMQHSMSRADNGGGEHVLLWIGATRGTAPTARFEDLRSALPAEAAHGWTLALGAADLDGDLLPELYIANDFGPDRLLRNRSAPGHIAYEVVTGVSQPTLPASRVLGRDSFKGMGVDFADVNGDGRLDICVSNIAEEYALEESHFLFVSTGAWPSAAHAPYVDRGEDLGVSRGGWGWDCRFGDFDNSGNVQLLRATGFARGETNRWPELQELAMGNDELLLNSAAWPRFTPGTDLSGAGRLRFYARAADSRFYDVARDVGLGAAQVTRGIATADVDGDGRLDVAVANQWDMSRFYHNLSPSVGAFLGLRLMLATEPLRPAVTAAARVCTRAGACQVGQVDGGNGHSGKRSHDLQFGFGRLTEGDSLQAEVRWRDANGAPRTATIRLAPGWHVLELGAASSEVHAR